MSTTSTSTTTTSTTSTTSTSTTINDITIEDVRSKLTFALQDDAQLIRPEEKELAINSAVRIYSKDRPLTKIKEDTSANGTKYDFTLPNDWIDEFSFIVGQIEYPVQSTVQAVSYLDNNSWIIYEKASGPVLRMVDIVLGIYTFRYKYTTTHIVSDTDCTIYENDFDAVCDLAASYCFRALAAKYSQTQEPTIDADVIDYARKADEYQTLAASALKSYTDHMGRGKDAIERPGAMAVKEMDITYPWGSDYLTHPKTYR